MLELKNISKSYTNIKVLNNVNIKFREKEFVSILGPSGSGKTTLLNIIGGLDKYDEGDLIIDGVVTKNFKESDWNNYRSKKIGFIFQNYNLINHLTVFENVELALLVNCKKNKSKIIDTLKKVGLENEMNKLPSELSGGQMQRVAIARAIINENDIILADEPTGALDSKTSIEVMNILKKISKERLVIMVTHNVDLANIYSDRIIEINDGKILKDTNQYNEYSKEVVKESKKISMSFLTSLYLSFRNLLTKKGRTFLVSFAGSIGIFGISLILSLSNGLNNYIRNTEDEYLSNYPITIYKTNEILNFDLNLKEIKGNPDKITSYNDIASNYMSDSKKYNNLYDFKKYVDNGLLNGYAKFITYDYNLELQLYKSYEKITSVYKSLSDDEIKENYDLLYGDIPKDKNEIVLIVDKNNVINDSILYSLGIKDKSELSVIYEKIRNNESINLEKEYNFDELLGGEYKLILNTDYYVKVKNNYVNKSNDINYMKRIIDNGMNIKIVGILKPKNDYVVNNVIGYKLDLIKYIIQKNRLSILGKEQLNNRKVNVLNNKIFDDFNNTYDNIVNILGINDLDNPDCISIYFNSLNDKNNIIKEIDNYNKNHNEKITYVDNIKTILNTITNIVNSISYILVGLVFVSLVVSSLLIAIITYISVLERKKEIGILKSLGASRKDVRRIFNCETIIEGFISGVIGVVIAIIVNRLINFLVYKFLKINIISVLSFSNCLILISLSIFLAFISGLIPSSIASKREVTYVLRSE